MVNFYVVVLSVTTPCDSPSIFALWSSQLRHRVVHGQFLRYGPLNYDTVWFMVNIYAVVLWVKTPCGSRSIFTLLSSELRHRVVHGKYLCCGPLNYETVWITIIFRCGPPNYDTVWLTVNFYAMVLWITTLCGSR